MTRFRKVLTLFDDYYDMMSDHVRMENYKKAIDKVVKPGDAVLDLGCGLGILSFMALQAGARKVYAIEKSDSIRLAKEVARLNGYDDRIEFINENSLNVNLPERVDVIVSETLGSLALEENTLEFTIDARKRFLKEGGRMIPEGLNLWVAPAESKKIGRQLSFWKDIYGIDFSPAVSEMAGRLLAEDVSAGELLSLPLLYAAIDLYKTEERQLIGSMSFHVSKNATFNGLAGWFTVKLADGVVFDTSPISEKTHWRQAFLPVKEPFSVHKGGALNIELMVSNKGTGSDETRISYDYAYLPPDINSGTVPINVGRNDPCPCGSGKKYKKCCGA
jgi:SAM-dependent methyltransferase